MDVFILLLISLLCFGYHCRVHGVSVRARKDANNLAKSTRVLSPLICRQSFLTSGLGRMHLQNQSKVLAKLLIRLRPIPSPAMRQSLAFRRAHGVLRMESRPEYDATIAEPGFFEKLGRRVRVYWSAAQVFADYKLAERTEKRLKRGLGIQDTEDSSHPSIESLWNEVHLRNSAKLTEQIKGLEGFWIKVGQYLSSRADVMPNEYLKSLASLQDSMPHKAFADVMSTMRNQLTDEEMSMFVSIDPAPLATASLAQVHRATLKDGREVVIKVQHQGVASLMIQDMANLKSILEVIAKFNPDQDFGPVIREYNKEVRNELDFRDEAANMEHVSKLLAENKVRAIVPKVVLAKEKVLVMDFCEGFPIRDLESLDKYNVNRELLLQRICEAWAVQMHVGGVFNADPHPGNILVSTRYTSVPVLLDFGLTKRLDADLKLAFARLMHASDETDVDALLLSFEEMGLKMNRFDPFEDMASMQRSFGTTVPRSQAKQVAKSRSDQYKRRVAALREDQGLQKEQKLRNPVDAWPAELVFFLRVTNMLKGLCSRLDVAYPYLTTMAGAARETLKAAVPITDWATQIIHASADAIETPLQQRLKQAVRQLYGDGQMVGLQICVIHKGRLAANIAGGVLGTANPRPVTPSTLFNVFSVGKAVLAIAMLRLLEEGRFGLDDPVAKYWPEFAANGKDKITVRHVLTHQSGLANALPDDATLDTLCDFEAMQRFIETAKPEHKPGSKTQYHYLTFAWICGGIVERVTGKAYDEYLDSFLRASCREDLDAFWGGLPKQVCNDELAVLSLEKSPRERRDSAVQSNITASNSSKQVLAKYRGREQLLNPSVFNMRKVREAKIPSANCHASAASLAIIFDSMLRDGNEPAPLARDTWEQARQQQSATASYPLEKQGMLVGGASFGLGFQLHEFVLPSGKLARSFGHSGLGGSIVLALPEADLSVAFLTNKLSRKSVARETLLNIVWDEFRLTAPASLCD